MLKNIPENFTFKIFAKFRCKFLVVLFHTVTAKSEFSYLRDQTF